MPGPGNIAAGGAATGPEQTDAMAADLELTGQENSEVNLDSDSLQDVLLAVLRKFNLDSEEAVQPQWLISSLENLSDDEQGTREYLKKVYNSSDSEFQAGVQTLEEDQSSFTRDDIKQASEFVNDPKFDKLRNKTVKGLGKASGKTGSKKEKKEKKRDGDASSFPMTSRSEGKIPGSDSDQQIDLNERVHINPEKFKDHNLKTPEGENRLYEERFQNRNTKLFERLISKWLK